MASDHRQVKSVLCALAIFLSQPVPAADWSGFMGGAAGAGADIIRDQRRLEMDVEATKSLMQQQHEQEMQRIRLEYELRMRELERNNTRGAQPPPGPQSVDERRAVIEAVHPGFVPIVLSQEFKDWTKRQPQGVRDTFKQRGPTQGLIYLLDLYKRDNQR